MRILCSRYAWALAAVTFCTAVLADEGKYVAPKGEGTFSLASYQDKPAGGQDTVVAEKTTVTTVTTSTGRDITGPVSLRTANALPPGELELKNVFGWSTIRSGGSDSWEYELELEYGLVENHQLLFALPLEIGDGRVTGNWDITLGWHWKLWNEDGGLPGTAIRQFVRIPTGHDSEGVDYEIRPIMTWTVSDSAHYTLSGYARSVNGDNFDRDTVNDDGDEVTEDGRHFRWGIITGFDYDLTDDFKLIWDYVYGTSITEGHRDNHSLEVGFDWHFAENQSFNFMTEVSLDGDDNDNASLGAKMSYVVEFGG
ncbi:MAG: hypothetical protein IT449_14100 [Phycisphaerales bacterium]|nr:hypothetical protein [Phycisphaerales bacterium]